MLIRIKPDTHRVRVMMIDSVGKSLKLAATLRWFTAGGAIRIAVRQLSQTWKLRHNSETIRDRQKRRPPRAMKSCELSNGENRIALRQLLQNRKWRHLWRHNLGSRWKLQKMAPDNFSIRALYNIAKNQHNPIKTVGRYSFFEPQNP